MYSPAAPPRDRPQSARVFGRRAVQKSRRAQDRGERVAQLVRQHGEELLAPGRVLELHSASWRSVMSRKVDDGADDHAMAVDGMAPELGRERGAIGAAQVFGVE